jgi:hypothetical protein
LNLKEESRAMFGLPKLNHYRVYKECSLDVFQTTSKNDLFKGFIAFLCSCAVKKLSIVGKFITTIDDINKKDEKWKLIKLMNLQGL